MTDPQDALKTPPTVHGLAGSIVGRFTLCGILGAGGMGQVYRAEDTILKRVVAIKRMAPQWQFEERDRQRFLKEAQRASALNHPNIAAIYDVLEVEGEILLVMEYVEGVTLRQRMKERRRRIKAPSTPIPTAASATIRWARSMSGATNTRKPWHVPEGDCAGS